MVKQLCKICQRPHRTPKDKARCLKIKRASNHYDHTPQKKIFTNISTANTLQKSDVMEIQNDDDEIQEIIPFDKEKAFEIKADQMLHQYKLQNRGISEREQSDDDQNAPILKGLWKKNPSEIVQILTQTKIKFQQQIIKSCKKNIQFDIKTWNWNPIIDKDIPSDWTQKIKNSIRDRLEKSFDWWKNQQRNKNEIQKLEKEREQYLSRYIVLRKRQVTKKTFKSRQISRQYEYVVERGLTYKNRKSRQGLDQSYFKNGQGKINKLWYSATRYNRKPIFLKRLPVQLRKHWCPYNLKDHKLDYLFFLLQKNPLAIMLLGPQLRRQIYQLKTMTRPQSQAYQKRMKAIRMIDDTVLVKEPNPLFVLHVKNYVDLKVFTPDQAKRILNMCSTSEQLSNSMFRPTIVHYQCQKEQVRRLTEQLDQLKCFDKEEIKNILQKHNDIDDISKDQKYGQRLKDVQEKMANQRVKNRAQMLTTKPFSFIGGSQQIRARQHQILKIIHEDGHLGQHLIKCCFGAFLAKDVSKIKQKWMTEKLSYRTTVFPNPKRYETQFQQLKLKFPEIVEILFQRKKCRESIKHYSNPPLWDISVVQTMEEKEKGTQPIVKYTLVQTGISNIQRGRQAYFPKLGQKSKIDYIITRHVQKHDGTEAMTDEFLQAPPKFKEMMEQLKMVDEAKPEQANPEQANQEQCQFGTPNKKMLQKMAEEQFEKNIRFLAQYPKIPKSVQNKKCLGWNAFIRPDRQSTKQQRLFFEHQIQLFMNTKNLSMGSFSRRDNYFEKGFEYPADFAELEAMKLGTNDQKFLDKFVSLQYVPPVAYRYVNEIIGSGFDASRNIKIGEFIAFFNGFILSLLLGMKFGNNHNMCNYVASTEELTYVISTCLDSWGLGIMFNGTSDASKANLKLVSFWTDKGLQWGFMASRAIKKGDHLVWRYSGDDQQQGYQCEGNELVDIQKILDQQKANLMK